VAVCFKPTETQIRVVDYDEEWPASFDEIAAPLRDAVGTIGARVEHVGSTAVPGLAAKPVIDVDVVLRSPRDVDEAIERLRTIGYVHQGDIGIAGREAFTSPPRAEPHHLYVVVAGSSAHADHIDFRDYLRKHPGVVEQYASLKKNLAQQHREDRLSYTNAKHDFISEVLATARRT
jgi:GrpB-like predicted nucleotidyltransferase (UPF0157 family)